MLVDLVACFWLAVYIGAGDQFFILKMKKNVYKRDKKRYPLFYLLAIDVGSID